MITVLLILCLAPLPGHPEAAIIGTAAAQALDPRMLIVLFFAVVISRAWWHILIFASICAAIRLLDPPSPYLTYPAGWRETTAIGAFVFLTVFGGLFSWGLGRFRQSAAVKPEADSSNA